MPFKLLHDPECPQNATAWYCFIPVVGWMIGYHRQVANEKMLWKQAKQRGPVPASAWAGRRCDHSIRDRITEIIRASAYYQDATFHPDDPFELMMVLRYGDLNEVEIMMALEDEYGIEFDDPMMERLHAGMTFCEFIQYVEGRPEPT